MPNHQEDMDRLRNMLKEKSIKRGPVTLASGAQSEIYVDARMTTSTAQGMELIGRLFYERLKEIGWMPNVVGGMARGAAPISIALSYESNLRGDEMRSAIMTKDSPLEIYGLKESKGLSIVIVEDTVSSGSSIADAIAIAKNAGMNVLGALCLVDRQMGATEKILADHGCQLHSIFLLNELIV